MELLSNQRAQGPARHDNGALGSERAAGANGDRGGEGLKKSDFGLNSAASEEDGLQCLGDAMTANFFRTKAGHEADDDGSDDWWQDRPKAEVIVLGQGRGGGEAVVESEIGDGGNQPQQQPCHEGGDGPDGGGERREQENAAVGGEIRQFIKSGRRRTMVVSVSTGGGQGYGLHPGRTIYRATICVKPRMARRDGVG